RHCRTLLIISAFAGLLLDTARAQEEPPAEDAQAASAAAELSFEDEWSFEDELQRPTRQYPDDRVHVEIIEEIPKARTWDFLMREPEPLFDTDSFAMKNLPHRYNAQGLLSDRKVPMLLHLSS